MMKAIYGHIAGGCRGETPFPTFADGRRELLLCERILESHTRRAWTQV